MMTGSTYLPLMKHGTIYIVGLFGRRMGVMGGARVLAMCQPVESPMSHSR